jgi:4-amino-4-deoxy-L-arabinose transferase-like glycosyltransferase
MAFRFIKHKYFYAVLFLFVIAEFIVRPTGNYPLNDDWTYGKSILFLFLNDKYDIGTSASSLWTHLMWGMLFTKVFGFSFVVLRISTLISSVVGLFVLYKLVIQISGNARVAFVACLVLLFNPIYFNLSNTYMTDVNFSTLLICCSYFIWSFFKTHKWIYFFLVFIFSGLLVMLRQFGIVVPVSFAISCLFLKERKWLYSISAFVLAGTVLLIYMYYERYLEIHQAGQGFTSSKKLSFLSLTFWKDVLGSLKWRYPLLLTHIMVYPLPFLIIYLFSLIKQERLLIVLLISLVSFAIGFGCFFSTLFPMGNIFGNMHLGTQTFYEYVNPYVIAEKGHTYSDTFATVMTWVKCICISLFLLTVTLYVVKFFKNKESRRMNPLFVCFICFLLSYVFLLMASRDIYFDRYHLPLITVLIIAFSHLSTQLKAYVGSSVLFLVFMFYVSVFGTRDYFTMNDARWEAYRYLRFKNGIPSEKINAGYEPNCWHDGKPFVYYEFIFIDSHDYLIQYRKEPGFELYKACEFQRWFPYKKDSLKIYKRVMTK